MPSDETLRVTLVCTLPLLHFSHSRVAVYNALAFREVKNLCAATVRYPKISFRLSLISAPSSSAPAFSPARPLAWMPGKVRVTSVDSQLLQFLPWLSCDHVSLFGCPVGSGLVYRLLATVLSFTPTFHRTLRPSKIPSPRVTFDSHSQLSSVATPD